MNEGTSATLFKGSGSQGIWTCGHCLEGTLPSGHGTEHKLAVQGLGGGGRPREKGCAPMSVLEPGPGVRPAVEMVPEFPAAQQASSFPLEKERRPSLENSADDNWPLFVNVKKTLYAKDSPF